ncbi:hypothetical protein EBB05_25290 [Methylobacterium brachiatum]|nr:hypothetical protein EBB05_25290 [Methylobacterium brachiatum]
MKRRIRGETGCRGSGGGRRRCFPPPSAGEGGPRSGSGEGSDASGKVATIASSRTVALPLLRPSLTRGPPSPAEGGGDGGAGVTPRRAAFRARPDRARRRRSSRTS